MRLVKICAPSRAHFLLLFFGIVFGLSLTSKAHTVVLSEYTLEYKEDQWVLAYHQKTSQLRDAIYASRPDLKGVNLNSEKYLEATATYIASSIDLTYRGKSLKISPQHMKYGGLRFESTFLVDGLPAKPRQLSIKADGFDAHEHSVVLFRVTEGTEGYLNYFNQTQRLATYDFATHQYVFGDADSFDWNEPWNYIIVLAVLIGVAILGYRRKRERDKESLD